MIGHLRGSLISASPEVLLLDVGGVGYEVHIPLTTFYEIQGLEAGAAVSLHVSTQVRDDSITLFGFWTASEKLLFGRLLGVSGVGPKLARSILSGLPPEELAAAISGRDLVRLNAIPGVGKKTAERLMLELRDKVADLAHPASPSSHPADEDLVLALVNLGYRRPAAEQALAKVHRELPEAPSAEKLRAALRDLARL